MVKFVVLSDLDDNIVVHPFGTLAVMPMLNSDQLTVINASHQPHVVKLDNGAYYALPTTVTRALLTLLGNVGRVHGVNVAKDILEKGTGMVWNKGANNPYSYITAGYNGRYIEQRILTADLELFPQD